MTYTNKIKCPHCGRMSENLKPLREWTSQLLIVDEVSCPGCKGIFRIYHGAYSFYPPNQAYTTRVKAFNSTHSYPSNLACSSTVIVASPACPGG